MCVRHPCGKVCWAVDCIDRKRRKDVRVLSRSEFKPFVGPGAYLKRERGEERNPLK